MRNGIAASLLPVALYGGWIFAVSKHQSKVRNLARKSSEKMGKEVWKKQQTCCTLWWMTMCINISVIALWFISMFEFSCQKWAKCIFENIFLYWRWMIAMLKNETFWAILKHCDIVLNIWIFAPKMGKMHFWKYISFLKMIARL